MAVKVVDASALAALLFDEPEASAIAALLDGAQLVAPSLRGFEAELVTLDRELAKANAALARPQP